MGCPAARQSHPKGVDPSTYGRRGPLLALHLMTKKNKGKGTGAGDVKIIKKKIVR
jgi:hypothetical protein